MLFNFNNIQIIFDKIINKISGVRSINITNRPTLFSTVCATKLTQSILINLIQKPMG